VPKQRHHKGASGAENVQLRKQFDVNKKRDSDGAFSSPDLTPKWPARMLRRILTVSGGAKIPPIAAAAADVLRIGRRLAEFKTELRSLQFRNVFELHELKNS
jgi:hypothetical protein